MRSISSLSAVSMSASKSFATQRNGGLYEVGRKIVADTRAEKEKILDDLEHNRMSVLTNEELLRMVRSLLWEALSSEEFILCWDEKNFTFNIGKFRYCFTYEDSILSRLNAVLKFRQPK